ncbi:hypothetical protein ACFQ3S_03650 [Mucilaginibacter terrae]|uniref:hypothetical protein n=1 Tax=Mucilaginibacter terrae TaxID=1955052 RepID=UPI00362CAC10
MKSILLTLFVALVITSANAQTINKEQRAFWNGFVDFLEVKGLKGSAKLDKPGHENSVALFNEYCKLKGLTIPYKTFITQVQTTISVYRAAAWSQVESGKAIFDGKEADFMPGLSVIDGWAGSHTTNYKFPTDSVAVVAIGKPVVYKKNIIYETMSEIEKRKPLPNPPQDGGL